MSRTILVVDDDVVTVNQYAHVLGLEGFVVKTACDGESALRVAQEVRPDAILVDLRMPIMDGLTFLRAFQAAHGHVPAALVTGDCLDASEEAAVRSLGVKLMYKPIWTDQMIALVTKLLMS